MLLDLTDLRTRQQFPSQRLQFHQDALTSTRLSRTYLRLRTLAPTGRPANSPPLSASSNGRIGSRARQQRTALLAREWLNFRTCKCSKILMSRLIILRSPLRVCSYGLCTTTVGQVPLHRLRRSSQKPHTTARAGSPLKILMLKATTAIRILLNLPAHYKAVSL